MTFSYNLSNMQDNKIKYVAKQVRNKSDKPLELSKLIRLSVLKDEIDSQDKSLSKNQVRSKSYFYYSQPCPSV